jgi:hypothetical protein
LFRSFSAPQQACSHKYKLVAVVALSLAPAAINDLANAYKARIHDDVSVKLPTHAVENDVARLMSETAMTTTPSLFYTNFILYFCARAAFFDFISL